MTEIDALGAHSPTEKTKEIDGIPEIELWSLDATLTDYILPRIKAFRKMERHGYPIFEALGREDAASDEEWKEIEERNLANWENILVDIENAFQLLKNGGCGHDRTDAQHEIITKGLELFAKHYEHLWD